MIPRRLHVLATPRRYTVTAIRATRYVFSQNFVLLCSKCYCRPLLSTRCENINAGRRPSIAPKTARTGAYIVSFLYESCARINFPSQDACFCWYIGVRDVLCGHGKYPDHFGEEGAAPHERRGIAHGASDIVHFIALEHASSPSTPPTFAEHVLQMQPLRGVRARYRRLRTHGACRTRFTVARAHSD